jgi:hypothetical protein
MYQFCKDKQRVTYELTENMTSGSQMTLINIVIFRHVALTVNRKIECQI